LGAEGAISGRFPAIFGHFQDLKSLSGQFSGRLSVISRSFHFRSFSGRFPVSFGQFQGISLQFWSFKPPLDVFRHHLVAFAMGNHARLWLCSVILWLMTSARQIYSFVHYYHSFIHHLSRVLAPFS
jgi:hypothetical protein